MKIIHYILIGTLVLIAFLIFKKISVEFFSNKSAYAQESKRMPILPLEVMRRTSEMTKMLEWSIKKHLSIFIVLGHIGNSRFL